MLTRWEKIEGNKVRLEIEVAAPDVDTALAKAYRKVVKKVNLPGFRKGKVPRRILEARFGPEILHEEALEILVPPAYQQALKEADVEPIEQPSFKLVQIEEGKPLIVHATVEVLPPVELGEYKGIVVEQEEVEITDEQVEQSLEAIREQHARLVPKEEGAAAEGDLVLIDFKGFIDGEPFSGGEAENYSLELGSGRFIPGFEEQLVGASAGEEREVKVTFPEDYRKEELAGKEAVFQVTVKEIKEKKLPDLDDEFAKEVSDKETLEEFKAQIRERLENNAREQSRIKLEETLIEKLTEASKVEPPPVLIERQIDRMLGELEQYLRFQGLTLEKFCEMSGKSIEELRQNKQEEAAQRVKANLVLDALIKKEGITVEDSEVDEKIAAIAAEHNDDPERVRELFEKQGRLSFMREEMRMRKVIDLLVSQAQINKVKKSD
ncbi:MAG TPA: trigger factor [Bacillota bacterium]|nr:trigger factor [Bacillota bacterium]